MRAQTNFSMVSVVVWLVPICCLSLDVFGLLVSSFFGTRRRENVSCGVLSFGLRFVVVPALLSFRRATTMAHSRETGMWSSCGVLYGVHSTVRGEKRARRCVATVDLSYFRKRDVALAR